MADVLVDGAVNGAEDGVGSDLANKVSLNEASQRSNLQETRLFSIKAHYPYLTTSPTTR